MGPGKMAAEYTHSHGSKVAEVMTRKVYSVGEDATLEDIVELMERHRIKRVPVLRGQNVIGIVTRSNLMHAMVSLARTSPGQQRATPPSAKNYSPNCKRKSGRPLWPMSWCATAWSSYGA